MRNGRSKYYKLILLVGFSFLLIYSLLWLKDFDSDWTCKQKIAALELAISNIKKINPELVRISERRSIEDGNSGVEEAHSKQKPTQITANQSALGKLVKEREKNLDEYVKSNINREVSKIESLVALDEDQKKKLIERFELKAKILRDEASGALSHEETDKQLSELPKLDEILGEDATKKFHDIEKIALKRQEEELEDFEVFKLQKALDLSISQQEMLRQAMHKARQEYMSSQLSDGAGPDQSDQGLTAEQFFNRRRVRIQFENAKTDSYLSPLLSESQLNRLLEYRATNTDLMSYTIP